MLEYSVGYVIRKYRDCIFHIQANVRRVGDGEDDGERCEGAGGEGCNIHDAGEDVSKGRGKEETERQSNCYKMRVSTQSIFYHKLI